MFKSYIYFACFSGCLFVTDKRQNIRKPIGNTFFVNYSHDPREGL